MENMHIDYIVKRRFETYKTNPTERTFRLFIERLNAAYSRKDRQAIKDALGFKYIEEMKADIK